MPLAMLLFPSCSLTAVVAPRLVVSFFVAALAHRGGIPTGRGQLLSAPVFSQFAVNFFVTALAHHGGIPTIGVQLGCGGACAPWWYSQGSRYFFVAGAMYV